MGGVLPCLPEGQGQAYQSRDEGGEVHSFDVLGEGVCGL